jgi:hypothetical protein
MSSKSNEFASSLTGSAAMATAPSMTNNQASSSHRRDSSHSHSHHHRNAIRKSHGQFKKGNIPKDASSSQAMVAGNSSSHHTSFVIDDVKALNMVRAKSSIKCGFGSNTIHHDSIQTLQLFQGNDKDNNDRLLFKIGNQIAFYDPDTNTQSFAEIPKNILQINHFCVSQNYQYLSVCESSVSLDNAENKEVENAAGLSQASEELEQEQTISSVAIYDVKTMKRLKTLPRPKSQDILMSSFNVDGKLVANLIETTSKSSNADATTNLSVHTSKEIVVWNWEKEKIMKSFVVPDAMTRIRFATCSNVMLTSTGFKHLKTHYISTDLSIKTVNLLPPSRYAYLCLFLLPATDLMLES